MEKSGAIIGMPFSLEGFAFFTEAIFLGLYLMGWKRLPPLVHWFCGVLVILGGVTSGIFVVTANAWMNTPAGFKIVDGKITDIDPIAAMLNPAAAHEVLHMTLAAFIATGFAVAAIHAFFLLRDRRNAFHRNALGMALALACTSAPLQLISGDFSARSVAKLQPAKLAAMESRLPDTNRRALAARWNSGRPITHHAFRFDHSARPQPSGQSRSEQQDHRAGSICA
jgi:Cytochrome bd-type quinol oxidase, subunit 1